MSYINSYCQITNDALSINGEVVHVFEATEINGKLKEIYLVLGIKYPKFYKMDELSKLSIIGTEFIKKDLPEIEDYGDHEIALLFSNRQSSATTDSKFLNSYENGGIPSPSLFVYTLPNILIGELSIRNKWYGENMFTVSPGLDANYFSTYSKVLLHKNSEAVLCGWVNAEENKIEAFFFFVSKKEIKQLNLPLSSEKINEIYSAK